MDRSGAQSAPTSSLGNSHRPQTFDVPADRVAPEKFRGNNQTWLLPTITRTDIVRVMAYLTAGVEYGLHCLLWLAGASGTALSSRDLGELQGVSSSFLAKIFPKLEKAGIVTASEGIRGGYLLARRPEDISVLDVVDAIEGRKPLFDCQEIRGRCVVFEGRPPEWASKGVCAVHATMLRAEKAMRASLAKETLADIGKSFASVAPPEFSEDVSKWIEGKAHARVRRWTGKDESSS
jgi:Rrf2 family protein